MLKSISDRQVEHTVTEEITGIDIVGAQLRIACGATLEELGLAQENIQRKGFAIQCRVNTEIPSQGFRPDSGTIRGCRLPVGRGVRLDHSECFLGAHISLYYDPLLVKCICSGADMASGVSRAIRALKELQIVGVQTNIAFLLRLLEHPVFVDGNCWTSFIDDNRELCRPGAPGDQAEGLMRFLATAAVNGSQIQGQTVGSSPISFGRVLAAAHTNDSETARTQAKYRGWSFDGPDVEYARYHRLRRAMLQRMARGTHPRGTV